MKRQSQPIGGILFCCFKRLPVPDWAAGICDSLCSSSSKTRLMGLKWKLCVSRFFIGVGTIHTRSCCFRQGGSLRGASVFQEHPPHIDSWKLPSCRPPSSFTGARLEDKGLAQGHHSTVNNFVFCYFFYQSFSDNKTHGGLREKSGWIALSSCSNTYCIKGFCL